MPTIEQLRNNRESEVEYSGPKTKSTNLQKIIKPFFGNDEYRPHFKKAMYDGKYGYATNGHCCIRWKDDQHEPMEKTPSFDDVYNKERDIDFLFSSDHYRQWKSQLKKVPDFTECEYCEATGEVQWQFEHFTKMGKCPHCEGKKGFSNPNLLVPDPKVNFTIYEAQFKQEFIERIIHVMDCLNISECNVKLKSDSKTTSILFSVDKFDIIIMPCIQQ